jgi:hypothetical protein
MPVLASVDEPLLRRAGSVLLLGLLSVPGVVAPVLLGGVLPALLVLIVPLLVVAPGVVVGPGVVVLGVVPLVLGSVLGLALAPGVVVEVEPAVPGVVVVDEVAGVEPVVPVVLLPGVAVLPVVPVLLPLVCA